VHGGVRATALTALAECRPYQWKLRCGERPFWVLRRLIDGGKRRNLHLPVLPVQVATIATHSPGHGRSSSVGN
jgi:hypothetical protein